MLFTAEQEQFLPEVKEMLISLPKLIYGPKSKTDSDYYQDLGIRVVEVEDKIVLGESSRYQLRIQKNAMTPTISLIDLETGKALMRLFYEKLANGTYRYYGVR
jgi:hypothetical protein